MEPVLATLTSGEFAHFTLRSFGGQADITERLIHNTTFDQSFIDHGPRLITINDQRQFVLNMNKEFGPEWILRNAQILGSQDYNVFASAVKTSPSIAEAMDIVAMFGHTLDSTLFLEQFNTVSHRFLSFNFIWLKTDVRRSFSELTSLALLPLANALLEKRMQDIELWFSYAEPSYSSLYRDVFNCKVKFGQNLNAWVVPISLLDITSPLFEPARHAKAKMDIASQQTPVKDVFTAMDSFVSQLKDFLRSYPIGRPSVDEAAFAMKLSKRSFTRKLNQAGTSFRELSDQALQERAQTLMKDYRTSRLEIAEKLGYTDTTSLSRALTRWRRNQI